MPNFYGANSFDAGALERLTKVYGRLSEHKTSRSERSDSVSLLDLYLISVVCNALYGVNMKGYDTPYQRLKSTQIILKSLSAELETIVNRVAQDIKEDLYEAQAEHTLEGVTSLLKTLTVSLENIVIILNESASPYGLPELIEGSLTKALAKGSFKVKPKPEGNNKDT